MKPIIREITQAQVRSDLPAFKTGDTVRVHYRVREGDKERTQVFAGIVIAKRGGGPDATFTVRRISYGEGVERVFPQSSPFIEKIEIDRIAEPGKARRYYLRKRVGKSAMQVKEQSQTSAA